jgi:hypothetical protein
VGAGAGAGVGAGAVGALVGAAVGGVGALVRAAVGYAGGGGGAGAGAGGGGGAGEGGADDLAIEGKLLAEMPPAELKVHLAARGLALSGKKKGLLKRLADALAAGDVSAKVLRWLDAEEELAEAEFFGDRAEGCGARRGALALRRREVAGLFG